MIFVGTPQANSLPFVWTVLDEETQHLPLHAPRTLFNTLYLIFLSLFLSFCYLSSVFFLILILSHRFPLFRSIGRFNLFEYGLGEQNLQINMAENEVSAIHRALTTLFTTLTPEQVQNFLQEMNASSTTTSGRNLAVVP